MEARDEAAEAAELAAEAAELAAEAAELAAGAELAGAVTGETGLEAAVVETLAELTEELGTTVETLLDGTITTGVVDGVAWVTVETVV